MVNRITEKEIITAIAQQTGINESLIKKIFESVFVEIVKNLDQRRTVTVKDFGTFYIKPTELTRTFKFNPGQRLRSVLGWSTK
jgi:DNA-binding protein HU-beta